MKILLTTPIFPPESGGPASYVKELAYRLRDKYQVVILAFVQKPPAKIDEVEIFGVNKKWPLAIRQTLFLKKLLSCAYQADIIYAQQAMAAGMPSAIIAQLLNKKLIIKFVGDNAWETAFRKGFTTKTLDNFLKSMGNRFTIKIRRLIQKWVLSKADKIIVPSDYLGEVLKKFYSIPPEKVITIYNAAEQTENDSGITSEPTGSGTTRILAVARLAPWKNVDGIIKAVKILQPEFPDIELVVAGDGPEMNNLQLLAQRLGIQDRIKFLGNVSKKETAAIRKQSRVFVLNSIYEGLPHSVLSSFAAGIPVVATDISGTNESVYDGKTGLLVKPNNPPALAQAIKKILLDGNLTKTLTTNAKILLREKFSWETHLNSLYELFESLVPHPRN